MTLEIPREKHGSNMSTPTTFQMFKLRRFWAECFHSNIEEDESLKLGKHCIVKKSVHQHGWPQFQIIFGVTVWLVAGCILWWEPLPIYWLSASSFQTNQPTPGYLSPHRLRNDDGFQISPFPQLLFKILRATTKNRDSWPIIKIRDQISSSWESLWGLFGGR